MTIIDPKQFVIKNKPIIIYIEEFIKFYNLKN